MRRVARPWVVPMVTVLVGSVAACADESPPVVTIVAPPPSSPDVVALAPGAASGTTSPAVSVTPLTVDVHVENGDRSIDADLAGEAGADGNPFGDFATCSGLRAAVGAYAVGVSSTSGPVTWVSVVSSARLQRTGTVDADVRVELAGGASVEATGTMTIAPDLASGSFLAFDPQGERISGKFVCAGASAAPMMLSASDQGAIEVIALMRRSDAERVVTAARLGATESDCPAGVGAQPLILRIDGDALGSITTFELSAHGSASGVMRMRVGDEVYEFGDVVVSVSDTARAGTFSATRGTLTVDGAFSCT